jgi:hypothetical protein
VERDEGGYDIWKQAAKGRFVERIGRQAQDHERSGSIRKRQDQRWVRSVLPERFHTEDLCVEAEAEQQLALRQRLGTVELERCQAQPAEPKQAELA